VSTIELRVHGGAQNTEVWLQLASNRLGKSKDLKLANIQKAITGASVSVLRILDALRSGKELDKKALFRAGLEAVTLLGHASHEVSLRRRESLQPLLSREYSFLCQNKVSP
jgi:hypothetical protein